MLAEEHGVLSISRATTPLDTPISQKELEVWIRDDILRWEKDLGGVGRKGERDRGGMRSTLLFHLEGYSVS